jgi:hypothetical protein
MGRLRWWRDYGRWQLIEGAILALLAGAIFIGVVAVLFSKGVRPAPSLASPVSWLAVKARIPIVNVPGPVARGGEWVTNLNGTRVCRLVRDVDPQERAAFTTSWYWRVICGDWRQPEPQTFAPLPDWIRVNPISGDGNAVHVEDGWR